MKSTYQTQQRKILLNFLVSSGDRQFTIEEIIEEDPEYIFVTTMGNEEKALKALEDDIGSNPAWNSLYAVKNNKFIVLPKDLFHYKPNARWAESYEYLARILYPEVFYSE